MEQDRDPEAIQQRIWLIRQLRAMGTLSVVFLLAVAALWVSYFSGSPWQALLAFCLAAFSVSWVASVLGVQTSMRRLAEGKTSLDPKSQTAVEVARIGLLLGAFGFIAFFLIDAS